MLFTFYIEDVLKLKKNNSGPKRLNRPSEGYLMAVKELCLNGPSEGHLMAVEASAIQHNFSCGQSPIPAVTIPTFTKLTVTIFQRYGTGIRMWSGTLETEVGKKIG